MARLISENVMTLGYAVQALHRSLQDIDNADLHLQKVVKDDSAPVYALIDKARLAVTDAKTAVEAMRGAAK